MRFPCLALTVLLAMPVFAHADDQVQIELLADVAAVQPGRPFTLGVRLTIRDGWHVYWTNPGDAGEATTAVWIVPPGFDRSGTRYPTPIEMRQAGDIVSIGYEKTVLLTAIVSPPETIDGATIEFGVDVDWLACADTCIPGAGKATLTLPVGEATASKDADSFAAAEATLPKPTQPHLTIFAPERPISASGGVLEFRYTTNAGERDSVRSIEVFPPAFADGMWDHPKLQSGVVTLAVRPFAEHQLPSGRHTIVIGYNDKEGRRRGVDVTFEIAGLDAPTTRETK